MAPSAGAEAEGAGVPPAQGQYPSHVPQQPHGRSHVQSRGMGYGYDQSQQYQSAYYAQAQYTHDMYGNPTWNQSAMARTPMYGVQYPAAPVPFARIPGRSCSTAWMWIA